MKMRYARYSFCLFLIMSVMVSCAAGKVLMTKPAGEEDVTGLFNVIFYSRSDYDRLLKVVVLDVAGDDYELRPYAPDYDYKVHQNVQGDMALKNAVAYVSDHRAFEGYRIKRVFDAGGNVIAYEVRPLYSTLSYGISDVMDIYYQQLADGQVRVHITLKERVKRIFYQDRDK